MIPKINSSPPNSKPSTEHLIANTSTPSALEAVSTLMSMSNTRTLSPIPKNAPNTFPNDMHTQTTDQQTSFGETLAPIEPQLSDQDACRKLPSISGLLKFASSSQREPVAQVKTLAMEQEEDETDNEVSNLHEEDEEVDVDDR